MKRFKWVTLVVLVAFTLASVMPAYAAKTTSGMVQVRIKNNTGETVTLRLSGPAYYTFNVKTGNSTVEVKSGTYDYSYYACGQYVTGKLPATGKSAKLSLESCKTGKASSDMVKVKIKNSTGATVTLRLSGPAYYTFTVKAGNSTVEVKPGTYDYSYYACGQYVTGKLKATGKNARLTVESCNTGKSSSQAGMVSVRIKNLTGGTMTLYLTGPQSYVFSIPAGGSTISVARGTYSYRMSTVCGTATGTVKFNKKMNWTWWCN